MIAQTIRRGRRLAEAEDGFTLIVAMGVLLVTALLTSAAFLAVQSDARLTRADLNGKQAYAAAQAGIQQYLYALNSNSITDGWEQCANDVATSVAVPGSTTGATYSYAPVTQPCATGNEIDPATGELQLVFTGQSGSATRTIVASFATNTPLNYLWYTVHETLDPAADSNCTGDPFYYNQTLQQHPIPAECQIKWVTGDSVNGPLFTQDQLLIGSGQSPSFQSVTSNAPSSSASAVCVSSNCGSATFSGSQQTVQGGGASVNFPTDNSSLLPDAQANGLAPPAIPAGTIDIQLQGSSAVVLSCPTSACSTVQTVNLATTPIIYATNASGCNTTYNPYDVTYSTTNYGGTPVYYGPCGDIYVTGSYSQSLTLAAQNDIVIYGSVTNSTDTNPTGTAPPTGTATLGLVADQYVRVYHPATISNGTCTGSSASDPNVTIDAAILTLSHSFFVDNYTCGKTPAGTLTVHGAIAQEYRGAVATISGNTVYGYLKNYNYDPRLGSILPPYMFDLQDTQWSALSETLCSTAVATTNLSSCSL